MLIVKIHYGLGNQLFQYALARSLASRKKVDYRLDTTFYSSNVFTDHPRIYQLDKFNIREKLAGREEIEPYTRPSFLQRRWRNLESRLWPYYKQRVVNEVRLDFDENIFLVNPDAYLFGYWQDLRYFSAIEDELKKELTFRDAPEGRNKELLDQIRCSSSVSLHIRRGDYLTDSHTLNNVDSCNSDYYRRAAEEMARDVDKPVFFIFTDDPTWVRENFRIPFQTVFVDGNPEENAVEDLRLMSNCRFHITANSSFSWWAAWLSGYPDKKVIVPKTWRSKGPNMHTPAGWMAF